jgi:hypothetical protein
MKKPAFAGFFQASIVRGKAVFRLAFLERRFRTGTVAIGARATWRKRTIALRSGAPGIERTITLRAVAIGLRTTRGIRTVALRAVTLRSISLRAWATLIERLGGAIAVRFRTAFAERLRGTRRARRSYA